MHYCTREDSERSSSRVFGIRSLMKKEHMRCDDTVNEAEE